MKQIKYFATLLFSMVICFCGYADSSPTTEDVENYKGLIMSYVKTEGYMPSIDSDGDIQFKHDGDAYWIQAQAYDDGYYVTVLTLTRIENDGITKARKALDESIRSFKYVRGYTHTSEEAVEIEYSWYCVSIADFKRMFSTALYVVSSADKRFIENMTAE